MSTLRRRDVLRITGLSNEQLTAELAAGRFPLPSANVVQGKPRWDLDEVMAYVNRSHGMPWLRTPHYFAQG